MPTSLRNALILLRLGMGWYFIYAGISKIMDAGWSAAGYLNNASTFPEVFAWLAAPERIEIVSTLNAYGLLFIGIALVLGFLVRYASYAGIILMILYWLPALDFPHVGNAFIVDSHIIYILIFIVFIASNIGNYVGLDKYRK